MPQSAQTPASTALLQAATSTFESLALLFPEPTGTDAAEFIPLAGTAEVQFHGSDLGRCVVGVTAGVLPALAENMLGAAAAPDPQLQRDALGELANVVTGNVLPLVHGATAVFRLNAPVEAGDQPLAAREGEVRDALVRLQMDEGEAIIALFARTAAPAADATAGTLAATA